MDENAFQFFILESQGKHSVKDPLVRETIWVILETFFLENNPVILYICDMSDGKQAIRNRLFSMWYYEYEQRESFTFLSTKVEVESTDYYASVLVKNSNPQLEDIKVAFNSFIENTVIRELKEWAADMSVEVSTSLLYHIFIRFYNTMLQIDEDDKYRSAGMKFNAYIVALLNAALVEEMAEYGIPNMNFNVIGDIETIYIHNRKAASSKMTINGKTDFYKWLSECPLLEIFLNPFLKYLMQNDIEEKEQYLNELLKYDQMNNKLALLLKKQENVLWELKRYNGIQEWIKYFIQLKEVEEKLSTYNTSEFLLPGEEEEYQQLLKEKQTLRKKTKNIIKVDELEVLLHNGMDEMQVDFIKDDISNKMSETKLGLRELFNEINLLKGKIKNVADFVKANYESLHQSDSPVFAILNAIYI